MKNVNQSNQSLESLMKISPLSDVYQEPKQTYTRKGGWFGLEEKGSDATPNRKTQPVKSKSRLS
ncbi:hypothetical protein [Rubrolithibacter danxiaensis]|uniref:hypothetical protein n=1 Tax=Rubrolithibacter danxiaensis TaxID=3390805 RepID=UPI003BF8DE2F